MRKIWGLSLFSSLGLNLRADNGLVADPCIWIERELRKVN
jgi:hypothetical protein